MPRQNILVALSLLIFFWGSLCYSASASRNPDPLILCPGARAVVRSGSMGRVRQLRYHLNVRYPAGRVIDCIAAKLRGAGWEHMAYDFLNPGLPASVAGKWSRGFFGGPSEDPTICNHLWIGDWKNTSGDIVRYMLLYQHVGCGTSDLTDLQVIGVYMPAAYAQRLQQAAKQPKKNKLR
jgi:hypothetical protein